MTCVSPDDFGHLMHANVGLRADVALDAAGERQGAGRGAIGAARVGGALRFAAGLGALRAGRERGMGDDDRQSLGANQAAHRHRVLDRAAGRIDDDRQATAAGGVERALERIGGAGDDFALGGNPFRTIGPTGCVVAAHPDEAHRRGGVRRRAGARRRVADRRPAIRRDAEGEGGEKRSGAKEKSACAESAEADRRHCAHYRVAAARCRGLWQFPSRALVC